MAYHPAYVGRFAPSPTGPLHFGSLVAAMASYLDARANNGAWLVRIEDLDPPRESNNAPGQILRQLATFGLKWDGDVLYQSTRRDAYQTALKKLDHKQKLFACICSRKSVPGVYGGQCRGRRLGSLIHNDLDTTTHKIPPFSVRLKIQEEVICFEDRILGPRRCDLAAEVGDFIIKRKDGLFAYQLAVVVDDAYQNINHIIRGNDLIDSTPGQMYLARCLGLRQVRYGHIPLILGGDGHKLSKQSHAKPVALEEPLVVLQLALRALGQQSQTGNSIKRLLSLAIANWQIERIPTALGIGYAALLSSRAPALGFPG